ncbi:MAG: amidohydrolase [Bacteroidetes bacterium]|nr:amidohydrolase [Bacteroidota bacterium]MBU1483553.1 amidohydrolase [Bacteroidota bacterium]MBU2268269.1 amidohydrolase [Bacteroidota bacterium]MBU2375876.1 amidohydrolase [Bacteroidota bacterium]
MRERFTNKLPVLLFLFLLLQFKCYSQQADLILINGKIFTSDTSKLFVSALAIKENKILAIGTNETIEKLASSKTKKIDLEGKTVIPGFNDAHDHLGWLIPEGKSFVTPFSVPGLSKKAVIDSLSRLGKQALPGQWVYGTIGLTVLNDTSVKRRLLDSIIPNNPAMLVIEWGHGLLLNTCALRICNIPDKAPDPLSGWYERQPGTGILTGALYEGAQFPAWQALAISEPDNLLKALRLHAQEEIVLGITTVQNMSSTLQGNAARKFFTLAKLPVRTRIIPMPGSTDKGRSLAEWNNKPNKLTALTYVSGIKYVIDGTPLEQTALMTKPYPNSKGSYGRLNYPIDTIKQILREALVSNRQLMMHIVGDSSTKIVLGLMKQMATPEEWKRKRVRIEHASSVITTTAMQDVKNMGIVLVHTPQYGKRSPLKQWLAMGIPIAIGPDALINPYLNIMFMTTQQADKDQNMSREQAVIAYTKGSAYAEFAENYKGTLTPGKVADLAVLTQDIFTVPNKQLPSTQSVLTMIDGKIIYQQKKTKNLKAN